MTLRIAVLLVRHGVETYADALDELLAFYDRQLPDVVREIVVIDNALPEDHRAASSTGVTVIGGSNAVWEFSAWDSGLAFLAKRLATYDYVHLVTAAFQQLYTAYIARFDAALLQAARGRAVAIGHIDRYDAPVQLFGRASQSWIRTSFLFAPPTEFRLLGSLASVRDGATMFSDDAARPFRADAPISTGYQDSIRGWLTGEGSQGVVWHSHFELNAETLERFGAKALAIINEHALTTRLRAQGCAPVDVTWLATALAQRPPGTPLGAIPDWQVQLAGRDVDAVPLSAPSQPGA